MTKPANVVAASRDLTIEAHPSNMKNLVCLGCLLDPERRNQSFPKMKLDQHLGRHRDRGHQMPNAA